MGATTSECAAACGITYKRNSFDGVSALRYLLCLSRMVTELPPKMQVLGANGPLGNNCMIS